MSNLREAARAQSATLREFTDNLPAQPAPDVDASGITADLSAPVHVAWSHVMAEVQWIGKDRQRNDPGGRYNFRGIEDVLNHVGPALRKHGVIVIPAKVEAEYEIVMTSNNKPMNLCRATVTHAVIGPQGDRLPVDIVAVGEAFDTGDKSSTKAQSVALRVAYIDGLNIPTQRPELDPEYGPQHELAAPQPPTAEEYHREILSDAVTLRRLHQIRAEFGAHPDIAATKVGDLDGTEITLGALLTRVGREKQAEQDRS